MPCYEVNLMSVSFNVQSKDLLLEALRSLELTHVVHGERIVVTGGRLDIDLKQGRVQLDRSEYNLLNKIKRQYSREVVKVVAQKKKWILKTQTSRKMEMRRY